MDKTRTSTPKAFIEIDPSESAYNKELIQDRRLQPERRVGGRRARYRPPHRALPLRADRSRGGGAGRSLGGRPPRRRGVAGEPVGIQRLLLQEERRRVTDRTFF